MFLTSYHNHTVWSDGRATIDEMIAAARKAGISEFGISDHLAVMPGGHAQDWSLNLDELEGYTRDMQEATKVAPDGMIIRMGIEIDYFPETIERTREAIAAYPFDYIIGSVHFVADFPVDLAAHYWKDLSDDQAHEKWRIYWQKTRELAEARVCDFIGHLDLPKKFGYPMPDEVRPLAEEALDAIAAAALAIEINTAGWRVPANEQYPSLHLLKSARRRNIPLLINADAHKAEMVNGGLEQGRAVAAEAGYTTLVRYEKRQCVEYGMEL